jgi:predicted amidophosphoribosyltransferase
MDFTPTTYHLCPKCFRAIPSISHEGYCPNDGHKMLRACPQCQSAITSPYARFCGGCGKSLALYNTPATELESSTHPEEEL